MCPNSSNGQHSYVVKTVSTDPLIIVRVCMLCQQEG